MTDDTEPKSGPETATGGCALGFGSLFVLAGIAFPLVLVFTSRFELERLMVPLFVGGPSFLLGHILAIVAIQSKSDAARQSGKRALLVMWSGVAVFFLVYLFLAPAPPAAK
jgi:uncharacterized membrane protein YhhN